MSGASQRPLLTAFAGLIALAAAMGMGRFVYTPILPFMEQALGLTEAQAGIIASVNYVGYMVGALAASLTGLPGSRRAWFLAALAISAISTAMMGLTTSLTLFLVWRLVGGLASAFVLVFASALVLDRLAAAGRPGLSALHFAGVGSGIALSAVLVSTLAAIGADWHALWLASGGLSLLAFFVVWRLIPPEPPAAQHRVPVRGGRVNPRLIALIAAYGLFGFGYVITATFISTIVSRAPDIAYMEPYVWLIVGLSAAPSVAVWNWIGTKLGNGQAFALACLVEAVGVVLSVQASSAVGVALSAVMFGGTIMGITALGLIHARSLSQGDPRRSLGLMTAGFGLGQMIGPTFAGYAYGIGDSFVIPSLIAAGALLLATALTTDLWHRVGLLTQRKS